MTELSDKEFVEHATRAIKQHLEELSGQFKYRAQAIDSMLEEVEVGKIDIAKVVFTNVREILKMPGNSGIDNLLRLATELELCRKQSITEDENEHSITTMQYM